MAGREKCLDCSLLLLTSVIEEMLHLPSFQIVYTELDDDFLFLLFSLRAPNDCFLLISTHIILHVHVITMYFPFCAYF